MTDRLVEKFAQALSEEMPELHPEQIDAVARTAAAIARGTAGSGDVVRLVGGRRRDPEEPPRPGLSVVRDDASSDRSGDDSVT